MEDEGRTTGDGWRGRKANKKKIYEKIKDAGVHSKHNTGEDKRQSQAILNGNGVAPPHKNPRHAVKPHSAQWDDNK